MQLSMHFCHREALKILVAEGVQTSAYPSRDAAIREKRNDQVLWTQTIPCERFLDVAPILLDSEQCE